MKYYKAEFTVECAEDLKQTVRELLADLAGRAGFEAFEETEAGLDGYVQMELLDQELLDEGIKEFPVGQASISYALSCVLDEDWNREWEEQGFDPIDLDGKILVFDARRPIPDILRPIEIGIQAKNAFGTGTHETTQMVLSMLLQTSVEGKRVLDCGCGTGIIGIAASKLGADEVVAYDIDENCVDNALHNAAINGVSNISVMEGDASVLSHISGVFDIVVANINRNTLLQDLPKYKEVLNADGTIILSGFYADDATMLLEKAWEAGLSEFARKEQGGWLTLVMK